MSESSNVCPRNLITPSALGNAESCTEMEGLRAMLALCGSVYQGVHNRYISERLCMQQIVCPMQRLDPACHPVIMDAD